MSMLEKGKKRSAISRQLRKGGRNWGLTADRLLSSYEYNH